MHETEMTRLAVARLAELDERAQAYRRSPDRPLQGFCLISGDELGYRISLYLENSKGDLESGAEYLGWIETGSRLEQIGRMAGWAAWEGSAACIREVREVALTPETCIRVTAGSSQVPVLEGSLVWLQGAPAETVTAVGPESAQAKAGADPVNEPGLEAEPEPQAESGLEPDLAIEPELGIEDEWEMAPAAVPVGVGAVGEAVSGGPQAFTLPLCDEDRPVEQERSGAEAGPTDVSGRAPTVTQAGPAGETFTELESEAAPEPTPEPASETLTEPAAEPVTRLTARRAARTEAPPESDPGEPSVPAEPVAIPLTARHPQAPRASGTALVDFAQGGLTVTLRAMPSPMLLGRDPRGEGTYTGYRVWLMGQNGRLRTPVGLCTRVWGENFRLQVESGLNFRPYDTIVVSAAERSGEHPNPTTPQVMVGTYRSAD